MRRALIVAMGLAGLALPFCQARAAESPIAVGDVRGVVQVTCSFAPPLCGDTGEDQLAHGRAWADAAPLRPRPPAAEGGGQVAT